MAGLFANCLLVSGLLVSGLLVSGLSAAGLSAAGLSSEGCLAVDLDRWAWTSGTIIARAAQIARQDTIRVFMWPPGFIRF